MKFKNVLLIIQKQPICYSFFIFFLLIRKKKFFFVVTWCCCIDWSFCLYFIITQILNQVKRQPLCIQLNLSQTNHFFQKRTYLRSIFKFFSRTLCAFLFLEDFCFQYRIFRNFITINILSEDNKVYELTRKRQVHQGLSFVYIFFVYNIYFFLEKII